MKKISKWLSLLFAIAIAGTALWFFVSEILKHLDQIREAHLKLEPSAIFLGVLCAIAAYLVVTQAWRMSLNSINAPANLKFVDSVAAVNIPSLTKYVPGKVWSYAIQMVWLKRSGFAPAAVLYTNLLNVFSSLLVSAWFSALLLMRLSPEVLPAALTPATLNLAFGLSVVASLGFIFLNRIFMELSSALVRRLLGRELSIIATPRLLLFKLQAYHCFIYLLFGLSSFFLASGLGLPLAISDLPRVIASVAIADSIGFLVLVVPGGLGVRESVMYFLLGGLTNKTLALLLPIATRLAIMCAEVLLGCAGFLIVKRAKGLAKSSELSS